MSWHHVKCFLAKLCLENIVTGKIALNTAPQPIFVFLVWVISAFPYICKWSSFGGKCKIIAIIHYMFFFTSSNLFLLYTIALKSTLVCNRANEAKMSVIRIINVKQQTIYLHALMRKLWVVILCQTQFKGFLSIHG